MKKHYLLALIVFICFYDTYAQGFLEHIAIQRNNSTIRSSSTNTQDWVLNTNDQILHIGKLNSDGKSDIIIKGSSGIGILTLDATNTITSLAMIANGARIRGTSDREWIPHQNDHVAGIGYFHPNYKHDLLIQGTSGIGILSLNNTNKFTITSYTRHTSRFVGGWRYSNQDKILGIGDFNNDNRSDFIIKSTTHLGVITVNDDGNFASITSGVNASYIAEGSWKLNANDEILGVGDFNADGHSDFIIKSGTHMAILSVDVHGNFKRIAIGTAGEYLNNSFWRLHPTDEILGIGDFNADGHSDFIIKSNTHIAILSLDTVGNFTRLAIGNHGEYLGNSFWRFHNTDKIVGIGDFNNDERDDLMIQSATHIGILSVSAIGNLESVGIMDLSTVFSSAPIHFPIPTNYSGVGDFNDDEYSDIVLKTHTHLGILTFKEDRIRFRNIRELLDCTATQNEELSKIQDEMLGIKGGDPEGDYISTAAARKPWRGKNWYPLTGHRQILSGKFSRFATNNSRPVRTYNENDWNIFIKPDENYTYLITDVLPYKSGNLRHHEWHTCNGVPCMEAEITPPKELNDYWAFSNNTKTSFLLSNQQVCVYGPWVREEVHGNRPEIHPSELIWWQSNSTLRYMLMIQDGSDRYNETKNFYGEPNQGWKPWAAPHMVKQFKIAFSIALDTNTTEQYTLDIGRHKRAETYTNLAVAKDIFAGRRYALEKNGTFPIIVIESSQADSYLGVTFDELCYNRVTNHLQGYIVVKAQIGTGVEGGAFLEIKLNKEVIPLAHP